MAFFEKILLPVRTKHSSLLKSLTEVCALFPDDRFHIGGDNAEPNGKMPALQARMEAQPTPIMKICRATSRSVSSLFSKKHGKRAVCWNDVLESKDVDTETSYSDGRRSMKRQWLEAWRQGDLLQYVRFCISIIRMHQFVE